MGLNGLNSNLSGLGGSLPQIDPQRLQELQKRVKENGGKPPDLSQIDTSQIDQNKFLAQFTKDFGEDAAKDIKGSDGKIDFNKVKSFLDLKFSEAQIQFQGAGGAPFGGGAQEGGAQVDLASILKQLGQSDDEEETNSSTDTKKTDKKKLEAKLLERIAKDFGQETADGLKNENGEIDEKKLAAFFEDKIKSLGSGLTGGNAASLLQGNGQNAQSVTDLLFGKNDEDKSGRYLRVSA